VVCAVAFATAAAPAAQAGPTASPVSPPTDAAAALVVGGTSFASMDDSLMSTFTTTFATNLINVSYPAQLYPFTDGDYLGDSVAAGVNNLLELLAANHTAGEHMVLWGISQGALVLDAAVGALAAGPHAPAPGDLTVVRVADPAAATTGLLNFLPDLVFSRILHFDSSVRATAENSPYDAIVITNQYDGFADFPDRPWNLLAVANSLAGLVYRHGQTATADLAGVPAQNITSTVNSRGATTTTYVVPSPFLPLTQPLRDGGVLPDAVVDDLDEILRPIIDAGYSRTSPLRIGTGTPPRRVADATISTSEDAVAQRLSRASATARSGPVSFASTVARAVTAVPATPTAVASTPPSANRTPLSPTSTGFVTSPARRHPRAADGPRHGR
jgi:hypothetical protein